LVQEKYCTASFLPLPHNNLILFSPLAMYPRGIELFIALQGV
jgi:hypothetical protein